MLMLRGGLKSIAPCCPATSPLSGHERYRNMRLITLALAASALASAAAEQAFHSKDSM